MKYEEEVSRPEKSPIKNMINGLPMFSQIRIINAYLSSKIRTQAPVDRFVLVEPMGMIGKFIFRWMYSSGVKSLGRK